MRAYNLFENGYVEASWNFKRRWLAVYGVAGGASWVNEKKTAQLN